eukprot:scaffold2252_cov118-Isochrysis_galbana.AAC.2
MPAYVRDMGVRSARAPTSTVIPAVRGFYVFLCLRVACPNATPLLCNIFTPHTVTVTRARVTRARISADECRGWAFTFTHTTLGWLGWLPEPRAAPFTVAHAHSELSNNGKPSAVSSQQPAASTQVPRA